MGHFDWISFTTDYGLFDPFVASCHGVIARLAPTVRIIDITHQIAPGDVHRGSVVMAETVRHLPASVHLAVVDPEVGTERRGVVIESPGGLLVGPDNGLLPPAAEALGGITRAIALTEPSWFAPTVSPTFHGRDVFAPVAARLASGADPGEAGQEIDLISLIRLPEPVVTWGDGWFDAEVRSVDRFGNVQLAARGDAMPAMGPQLIVGSMEATWVRTFAEAPAGSLVVYVDSAGYVTIAIHGGRAVVALSAMPGDLIRVANG